MSAVLEARDAGIAAEAEGEIFDTYNEDGTPLGRELRSVCHATGIWHRAVYAYLFNLQGELLIQRRSPDKKVAPGQWDLSVAEHLSPGESFRDGVARGLAEELGVVLTPEQLAALQGPLTPMHQRRLLIPEKSIKDFEFVEAYRLDGYEGPISFNQQEVVECRWVSLAELRRGMSERPEDFTIWFREEIQALDFFAS
ncbi:hypothetical protein PLESTB_000020200 [Pleodorina starrii]|uniref:Nudix hydrolase domain-containing protein n=1 Tax=Pleodorina starrii TaxID=330485 RepID=A0A9W6B9N8_9CHLO|nr:hypothetical protein PLESTM_001114600 [Pleodorina starrii]GLC47735.1 hypothetical protein PLESTB_000020200 [Pleodorina starrii]GLC70853.1 hypothetical protein PLESTF_001040000 [Pleodorina starrii]